MEKVLVFGAKGQLGSCLQDAIQGSPWHLKLFFMTLQPVMDHQRRGSYQSL